MKKNWYSLLIVAFLSSTFSSACAMQEHIDKYNEQIAQFKQQYSEDLKEIFAALIPQDFPVFGSKQEQEQYFTNWISQEGSNKTISMTLSSMRMKALILLQIYTTIFDFTSNFIIDASNILNTKLDAIKLNSDVDADSDNEESICNKIDNFKQFLDKTDQHRKNHEMLFLKDDRLKTMLRAITFNNFSTEIERLDCICSSVAFGLGVQVFFSDLGII